MPNIQIASLTEMSDLTYHVSKITADSFYLTVCLSNNSSLPNVSKMMKFNWIVFLSMRTQMFVVSNGSTFLFLLTFKSGTSGGAVNDIRNKSV